MLGARGAFAEAEPLRRRDLEARERILGPGHCSTLIALNNLASVLRQLGKLPEVPLHFAVGSTWRASCFGKNSKKTHTISDFVIYRISRQWTCQSSLAKMYKNVFKEQTPAGSLSVWGCRFLLQMEDWNRDDSHSDFVEMSTHRFYCLSLSAINMWFFCMVQLYVCIFFISPNIGTLFNLLPLLHSRRPFFSRLHTLGGLGSPMCPHHPETAGGGPLLQMSCYARSDTWCTAPAHAQLHEQLRCPPGRAGEAGAGWARGLWGGFPGRFRWGCFFVSPRPEAWYCWIIDDYSNIILCHNRHVPNKLYRTCVWDPIHETCSHLITFLVQSVTHQMRAIDMVL